VLLSPVRQDGTSWIHLFMTSPLLPPPTGREEEPMSRVLRAIADPTLPFGARVIEDEWTVETKGRFDPVASRVSIAQHLASWWRAASRVYSSADPLDDPALQLSFSSVRKIDAVGAWMVSRFPPSRLNEQAVVLEGEHPMLFALRSQSVVQEKGGDGSTAMHMLFPLTAAAFLNRMEDVVLVQPYRWAGEKTVAAALLSNDYDRFVHSDEARRLRAEMRRKAIQFSGDYHRHASDLCAEILLPHGRLLYDLVKSVAEYASLPVPKRPVAAKTPPPPLPRQHAGRKHRLLATSAAAAAEVAVAPTAAKRSKLCSFSR
jgi:hypothetical protein